MGLWNPLRYAGRQLRKSPAFSITVLMTLALCIGANTAIYTIVDALFFRPLPYPDPARLVMLCTVQRKGTASATDTSQDGRQWELIRDHATSVDSAVYGASSGVNLVAGGRVEYIEQQRVSANFFHVLGIEPLIGREFTREEDVRGGPALAILSYGLWQRVFRGDPQIAGRTIDLRGAPYTVVGIMPKGFRTLPSGFGAETPPDVWTPLRPSHEGEGGGDNYGIIARLKSGVTPAQANAQLNSILQDYFAGKTAHSGISDEEIGLPLRTGLTYDLRSRVHIMWGAVLLVLFIGCVNIAGILLARSAARSREIATRIALGARRGRIVSELLVEALLLAFVGGILGLILGEFALKALMALNPDQFSLTGPVHLDWRVMAAMLLLSFATSIVFGLFPAFEASSVDLRSALSEGGRGSAGGRRQWKRQALVFAEVALGVVLVVGAGLLVRTFLKLAHASPGFDPNHVTTATASLQDARYATTASAARLFRESLNRIRQIPGVESAAAALTPPYARPLNEWMPQIIGGSHQSGITNFTYATPGMFETLHMNLLRGRLFTDADNASSAPVAVVNEDFVKRYIGQKDPLSAAVKIEDVTWRVIGVVNDVQLVNGWGPGGPVDRFADVYVPVDQLPNGFVPAVSIWFSPVWMVRTRGNLPGLPDAMRRALASVDPMLPFSSFQSMQEIRGSSVRQQRYEATLFSVLAGLAILLAALGIYGLIAQTVAQRTREMGIRLALGASPQGVVRTAAIPGVTLALAGTACGIVLALFATRLLKSVIWGVAATDPATFVTVALLVIAVAALSSIIPALRLARLDPARTLREE